MARIIVLGGDGFCGWPTALHLSAAGYDVTVVDNFSRRTIDKELGCESLTPITTMDNRVKRWRQLTGNKLFFKRVDIARNYHGLHDVLKKLEPDAVVHFAEQRAAPYSMKNAAHKLYTVRNNIMATHNLLCALVDLKLDAHVVHLGSTGVYGYSGDEEFKIPEGYVDAELINGEHTVHKQIMYPPDPGSVYHMTKVMDAQLFYFYNKNDRLRITDLHQGVVWGTETEDTALHPELANRYDYDGDYGTVLNRFIMQGATGHPLTVYGTGEQVRAFIHIQNTVQCIRMAIEAPKPSEARVEVFNQTTEQLRLIDLAQRVAHITGAEIRFYDNPRVEAPSNELLLDNAQFMDLGLEPITLNDNQILKALEVVYRHKDRVDFKHIICTSTWRHDIEPDHKGVAGEFQQQAAGKAAKKYAS
jgi:UDP-sulfoquinovose synthase